jgi:hypothetical protein
MANRKAHTGAGLLPTIHCPTDRKEAESHFNLNLECGGHYHPNLHFMAKATYVQHLTRTFREADGLEPFHRSAELTRVAKYYGFTVRAMLRLYKEWVDTGHPFDYGFDSTDDHIYGEQP